MYIPAAFAVTDPAEIAAMLARARLATLVTQGPEGLYASHLPMIHQPERGALVGHLARTNPHRARAGDGEALAIFELGEAYVSPAYYPSRATGRVVPTWNYEVVHVYGRLTWHDEADWLGDNVAALTARFEAARDRSPWSLAEAQADYLAGMVRGTVGVELAIGRIEAKRKLSQNRTPADRDGAIAALSASDRDEDRAVAASMRRLYGPEQQPRSIGEADADSPAGLPIYPTAQDDGS